MMEGDDKPLAYFGIKSGDTINLLSNYHMILYVSIMEPIHEGG